MVLALFKGIMEPTGSDILPVTCATGNCTFGQGPGGSYASLGLCSKCTDVTSKLELVHAGSWPAYKLPGNTSVQVGTREPTSVNFNINTTASSLVQTEWMNSSVITLTVNGCVRTGDSGNYGWDCPNSAQNTYHHLRDDENLVPITYRSVVAAQCSLYPCARLYSAKIQEGTLDETILASFPVALPPRYKNFTTTPVSPVNEPMDNYTAIIEPCTIQGLLYDRTNFSSLTNHPSSDVHIDDNPIRVPDQCIYKVPVSWGTAFRREGTLSSTCFPVVTTDPEILYPNTECANRWLNPLFNNGNASFESISRIFDNIALAVTHRMRIIGKDEAGNPLKAEGQTMETRVCIRVNWYWLILPGGLAVLVVLLLAGVVIQSLEHRLMQPVWKSSLLPSLFYGLRGGCEQGEDASDEVSDRPAEIKVLHELASSTVVRFRQRGDGSHFEVVE